jgi:hypothetical protein
MSETYLRRGLVLVLLVLGLPCVAGAQPCQGLDAQILPMPSSYETLTVAGTAVPFTAGKYSQGGFNAAQVTVETAAISYTVDGTTPTATVGHQAIAGSGFGICGLDAIKAFRAIQVVGAATLKITYFRAR